MSAPKIFESEYKFCLILWENEPISSRKLSELCNERLGWSKTTTYTVIKRLSDRGVVKNENTVVTSLVSKEEALEQEKAKYDSEEYKHLFEMYENGRANFVVPKVDIHQMIEICD